MKPSRIAKQFLSENLAYTLFEQCERLVMGITNGTSVPLPLGLSDGDIIIEVVFNHLKETVLDTKTDKAVDRAIRNRANGLFKQWLIQKGRIK